MWRSLSMISEAIQTMMMTTMVYCRTQMLDYYQNKLEIQSKEKRAIYLLLRLQICFPRSRQFIYIQAPSQNIAVIEQRRKILRDRRCGLHIFTLEDEEGS